MTQLQAIRGMRDILPPEGQMWQALHACLEQSATCFGYNYIATPILEQTAVFLRSVGESSDIVTKEMYRFVDKGDNDVCLRPEVTAGVVRALLQNNLLQPHSMHRLYYFGPTFRYERPQKGRQRQFHQFGAECFGISDYNAELEMLALAHNMWQSLGIAERMRLHINSLGSVEDRRAYIAQLVDYCSRHETSLDADSKQRLHTNPLRILDSKVAQTQEIMRDAPSITDYLSTTSQAHFDALVAGLDTLGIDYRIENQLVRGLDYYNNCVFEYKAAELGAQDAVCGGGRYDKLTEHCGGKAFPAVGFAIGLERLALLVGQTLAAQFETDIYIICINQQAVNVAHSIRAQVAQQVNKWRIMIDYSQTSLRAQMQKANKKGASVVLILAEEECASNTITAKDMSGTTEQQTLAHSQLLDYLHSHFG